jgi:hypothetical protein
LRQQRIGSTWGLVVKPTKSTIQVMDSIKFKNFIFFKTIFN